MRVAAVIGSPVGHSLSPAIHAAGFRSTGVDWMFVAFEVAPGGAAGALDAMRVLGIAAPRGPATERGARGGRVPRGGPER